MASYRYERDIQPGDLKPRREKQYTRKERWANWWDYNLKWVILIGIAVAFVAYNFIGQYFFTTKADYLSLIHISEPTRRTPISYAVFCLKIKIYGLNLVGKRV